MVFLALLVSASQASAQSKDERAEEHFENASNLYFVGEYEKAIEEFEKANALTPDPIILYNISLAHEKLGNFEASIAIARVAATMGGFTEADHVRNDARILGMERILRARSVVETMPASVSQPEPEVVAEAPPPATSGSLLPDWSFWQWTAVGATAVGGTMMLVAAILELSLGDEITAYEAAASAGDSDDYGALGTQIRKRQAAGKVMLYGGLAVAGAGVTLWILDSRGLLGTESARLLVVPGGVQANVRF